MTNNTERFQIKKPVNQKKTAGVYPGRYLMKSQAGVTLIEIVVTLILVGILAAVGGMGIVQAVKGYITVKENAATTQKAQLAMARITREIVDMTDINGTASNTVLAIKNISQVDASNNPVGDRVLGFDASAKAVKIAFGATALQDGDVLINNVSNLNFTYYAGNATWTPGMDIRLLSAVDVSMTLADPNFTFTTRVVPRNNLNLGGANIPTVTPPIGPRYCFVATAAYGDSNHPMVQILREFRDKYLLSFNAGKWLVSKYYQYGPAAARMIQNKPFWMFAVRCLLAPVAAFAFGLMYAPLAIIFIFFTSLAISCALCSFWKRGLRIPPTESRSRGSILVGLIITMVIMAFLGAAMLPLVSASYMNQVYADQGRKAYYLAESGFNYASSEFLNASDKNAKLAEINGKTCNLRDDAGSFTVIVYPLWTVAGTLSGSDLPTTVYGSIPEEFGASASGGYLKIGNNYYSYSSRQNSGASTVTFKGISPVSGITSGQEIFPVVLPASTQTITNGGNMTISGTGAASFPRLNGNFTINGDQNRLYKYARRDGNVLKNITLIDPNMTWSNFTVTSGAITSGSTSKIVLEKFVRVKSTGTISGASRSVTYNAPVALLLMGGWSKQPDVSRMNNPSDWAPLSGGSGFGGTHDIASIDGDNALKVVTATTTGWWTTNKWAVAVFQGYRKTNLAKAWLDAGGFLSYDVQTKVYNTQPYYFAGINLRSRNNASNTDLYTYGVSFVRGRQYGSLCGCTCIDWRWWGCASWAPRCASWSETYLGIDVDDIDNNLVPNVLYSDDNENTAGSCYDIAFYRYSSPAIIFWKRNSSGSKVLAYRELTAADGILTGTSPNFRLAPWATLLVRIAEGYSLDFSAGNTGTPIKEGDIVRSSNSANWSARVVMTPILNSSCSWTPASPCAGRLVLANINGTFAAGDLLVNGTRRATTGTYSTTKRNYIKVYYGSTSAVGTANNIETDNNRLANVRNGNINWPPDDITELNSANDFMTLVTWTGTNSDASTSFLPASGGKQVIVDWDLTTPNLDATPDVSDFSGDVPALVTSSDYATSTYYDDFAIQMDLKAGLGFGGAIQE
jgi:prepilin-type N-terminal cleavage/methylation domain-containing protein